MVDESLGTRKRAFVALLETDDTEHEGLNEVFIGNRVSQAAVNRSGLLSGIKNTHGHASLPSQLSPEEVRLWETACAIEFVIPLDELVTVLKVADALGDEKCCNWARRVAERVQVTNWKDSQKADAVLGALLRLPPHLLPTVLSRCWQSVDDMLATFPPPLHLAAIHADTFRVFQSGTLEIMHCNAAAAFHALTCAPAADAAACVAELKITSESFEECPTATGALLARAAPSLLSITSLELYSAPLPQQWLRNFSACLTPAALPSLVQLRLSSTPESCPEMINCLLYLPALTALWVGFHLADGPPSSQLSLTAYAGLAATPATLPNLKYLRFEEGLLDDEECSSDCSHIDCPSCASLFLPMLCAPSGTKLGLTTAAACSPLQDLLAAVNRYPGLQDLHMQATLRGDEVDHYLDFGHLLPKLPPLIDFRTISTCPISAVALATFVASGAQKSLTSLDVSLEELDDMFSHSQCTPQLLTSVWGSLSVALRGLTGLMSLELDCICGVPPSDSATVAFSQNLAVGLKCLTNLTHLRLGATAERLTPDGSSFLVGAIIGNAVAALKALQSLCFAFSESNAELEFDEVQPVLDGCTQLQSLKHLKLDCDGVKVPQIMQFLSNQRALTSLELSYVHYSASVQGAAAAKEEMQAKYPNIKFDFKFDR